MLEHYCMSQGAPSRCHLPVCRGHCSKSEVNSIDLAVDATGKALKRRELTPEEVADLVLG